MSAISYDDIRVKLGERAAILGMTRVGKSTLAENLMVSWSEDYPKATTLVLDTKPRFKAQWQLSGLPAAPLYKNMDWGEVIPGSVVLPMRDIRRELKLAQDLRYRIIIAQIWDRNDINKCDEALKWAYMDRRKGRPLFIYVDELNNFFRSGRAAGSGIIMVITSGGERSTAFVGAAQRPRWISVEAIESMTKLYWFKTPYEEDIKHLKAMGVPPTAKPAQEYYNFYFFDRLTNKQGMCTVPPLSKGKKKNARR